MLQAKIKTPQIHAEYKSSKWMMNGEDLSICILDMNIEYFQYSAIPWTADSGQLCLLSVRYNYSLCPVLAICWISWRGEMSSVTLVSQWCHHGLCHRNVTWWLSTITSLTHVCPDIAQTELTRPGCLAYIHIYLQSPFLLPHIEFLKLTCVTSNM